MQSQHERAKKSLLLPSLQKSSLLFRFMPLYKSIVLAKLSVLQTLFIIA